jgi:hypothetical protein
MVYTHVLNRGPAGVRSPVDMLSGGRGGLMPIYIRYGDKNGVLYGNRSRVYGVMRIDINDVRP